MKKLILIGLNIFNKYKSQILYLFFGGLTTLLNIIIFFVLTSILKIEYQISNVIAWITCVIFAYVTNKIWVFESKSKNKKELLRETSSFLIARLITLGMEFILLYLFIEKFLMLEIIAKIIINVIVIVVNYIFSKVFIFNKTEEQLSKKKIKINLKHLLITSTVIFVTICTLLHKYEISEYGYTIKYASPKISELTEKSTPVEDKDSFIQEINIEKNAKKIIIYFERDTKEYGEYELIIKDESQNIKAEKTINDKYLNDGKYIIDASNFKEGKYELKLIYHGENSKFSPKYTSNNNVTYTYNDLEQRGSLNIQIYYKNIETYKTLYILIFIITIFFISMLLLGLNLMKKPLEKIFLFISIPVYLAYLIFIPPEAGHDEVYHWYRVFEITEGGLISDISDNFSGYNMPEGVEMNIPWFTSIKYKDILSNTDTIDYSNKHFIGDATMAVYSPVQYFPQVLGVTLAKQITTKTMIIYYIGRLFNLISCIALLYFAIKKIPYLKKLMFLLAFIPIAIEGFTTLSGDGMLIAVVYLFIAYILNLIKQQKILTKKDYIILILLGIFIAFSKLVYVPILGLLLLLPTKCFKNKKDKYMKIILILILTISLNLFWLKIASKYLQIYTMGKSSIQINNILNNPFKYFQIFSYSVARDGYDLLLQTFGKYTLWGEIIKNNIIPIVLLITSIILTSNEKSDEVSNLKNKKLLILIFLAISILIFTSLFIQWCSVGSDIIYGVQGRYFLPILIIPFIILCNHIKFKHQLKEEITTKILLIASLFASYIAIIEIIMRFL